ncbi:Uma2 family endonuclease [Roseofilum capinflatum]|uniref:Uma2 family endonuclease n=1 Tax=Roseofilum capinflatum BLCC-M114 TaxID=3022440 RepID=A0ABT7BAU9_9CYAN|nr:Uma2 family endonuclease [Roseofilum capinflatum]MDJ1175433.1 Uma2 family endonuclease [Roseofilum capinflatum BLCC-M114]
MSPTETAFKRVSPPFPDKETLPTMYDLPSEEIGDSGLPDLYHVWQAELCSATFRPPTYPPEQILVAGDLNLYYDPEHPRWYKRPDWYAVVGVPHLYDETEARLSYVFWQEEVPPIMIVELLSPGTRNEDLGKTKRRGKQPTKWEVYEQILGIPYYIVFDRYRDQLQVFQLQRNRYQEQELTESRFWFPELELGLGLWLGKYHGLERQWLRWYDAQGNWIPTPEEEAERANQRANNAEQRANAAEQAQKAAIPRLLSMGMSREQVAEILGLSIKEVSQWGQS